VPRRAAVIRVYHAANDASCIGSENFVTENTQKKNS
jgi:hypothetical protein